MGNVFQNKINKKSAPLETSTEQDVEQVFHVVKTALVSPVYVRDQVVKDVSDALNCPRAEIEFLFGKQLKKIDPRIFDFPDSERRRRVIRHNNLDAAE